ncbi:MAG: YgcG family protein [Nitrosomonadales bacterium]|nr:YgcG family protein [Nitrosomonadales bacterium]
MCRWLSSLLLLLLPLAVQAEVAIPALNARVTDTAGILQAEQKTALESKLAGFEQEKGSQIAILIVPTTQPEAIEQYAIRVVESWKLGRKGVDDGLLILVATDDRTMRIEVGYGLEGVIPDAIAKRVIAEIMTPYFRQGDFYGGLNAAVDQLIGLIAGEALPEPAKTANNSPIEGMLPLLLFGAIAVGGILRAIFGHFLGGTISGGLVGLLVWILGGGLLFAIVLGFIAFIMTLSGGMGGAGGGMGRGGFGGGGGGFSGGGGGFGGGGASGRW